MAQTVAAPVSLTVAPPVQFTDTSSNPPESVSSVSASPSAAAVQPVAMELTLEPIAAPPPSVAHTAAPAESAPVVGKVVTYHKVKKEPEAAAARQQQQERLEQLIDQLIQLGETRTPSDKRCV